MANNIFHSLPLLFMAKLYLVFFASQLFSIGNLSDIPFQEQLHVYTHFYIYVQFSTSIYKDIASRRPFEEAPILVRQFASISVVGIHLMECISFLLINSLINAISIRKRLPSTGLEDEIASTRLLLST